jgi:hypothetical protein
VGTEGAARASMEFLSDAIRGASPGIESGLIWPMDEACPDIESPKTFQATMGNSTASDSLTVTFAYGSVVVTALTAYDPAAGVITVDDVSQFAAGDFMVITDFSNAVLVRIDDVIGSTLTYIPAACAPALATATTWVAPNTLPAGSLVIRALRARFFIQDLDGVPTLFMDPDPRVGVNNDEEPLAEGIEDLQIVLGIDSAADGLGAENGTTNGDEWWGNLTGETIPAGAVALRAVRLSLVSRALTKVTGTAAYARPALEDHNGSTTDNYRRRVLTSIIEVRNMLGSK